MENAPLAREHRPASSLVRALAGALEAASRHGRAHHEVDAHVRRARRAVHQRPAGKEPWLIEQHGLEEHEQAPELLVALRRHRLKGLRLLPDASPFELRTLVDRLADEPTAGGLASALERAGVRRIWTVEWPPLPVAHRDLLTTGMAALEAAELACGRDARLVGVIQSGLRALEELYKHLEAGAEDR